MTATVAQCTTVCPPTCQRDCRACQAAGEATRAVAAAQAARIAQWRRDTADAHGAYAGTYLDGER